MDDDEHFEWDHPSDDYMMPIVLFVIVMITLVFTS